VDTKSGVSKMVAMLNDGHSTVGKGLIEGSGLSSPIVVEQLFENPLWNTKGWRLEDWTPSRKRIRQIVFGSITVSP
jgi:hypothetical protein